MDEPISARDFDSGVLDMGKMLGRREAFGMVAGRCSAAEAMCLREARETKQYKAIASTWEEFCEKHLHMSRAAADRTIRLLEEFGPDYFELTQLVRIPPDAYRAIAPAVKDKAVHVEGEAIELAPENSDRVAAAVARLRRAAPPPPKRPAQDRIENARLRGREVIAALKDLEEEKPAAADLLRLRAAVDELQVAFLKLRLKLK
jgi:hypothetical protein